MAFQYGTGAGGNPQQAQQQASGGYQTAVNSILNDPNSALHGGMQGVVSAAHNDEAVPTNYGGYAGGATDAANNFLAQSAANQTINQPQIQAAQGYGNQGLGYLAQTAAGQGPAQAAAQAQLQQGVQQGMLAQAAAANSARGGGPALAAAQANGQQNSLALTQNAGIQAAQLRAQMAGQAQQQLVAGAQGAQQVGQQGQQGLAQSEQGYGQLANSALLGQAQTQEGVYGANIGAATAANTANQQQQSAVLGGLIGLGTGALTAGIGPAAKDGAAAINPRTLSDERIKHDVEDASPGNSADAFLSTLKPYTYAYDRPEDEPTDEPSGGRYLGVMAQNVERGPTGRTLVRETPAGKAIEGPAALSAMLAGVGRMHERVSQLEAMAKGMRK